MRRVQPHDEVRARARAGAPARLRLRRDRPPRARRRDRRRSRARPRAPTRPRTSRTCSTCSGADELAHTLLPGRRADQGRGARARPRARAAHRRQAREHGRVLHHARRPGGVPRRAHPAPRRARSSTSAASVVGDARRHRRVHDRSAARPRRRGRRAPLRHRHRGRHRDRHGRAARRAARTIGCGCATCTGTRRAAADRCSCSRARTARRSPATLDGDEVVFASPQPRVAPGQVVAFYDGDVCCGGGIVAAVTAACPVRR